ncbi:hypothetical protein PAESOLCIP111_03686 [Paenibacillus solanacearum]|uniref:Sulfatase N-terminal domain-containing protein n=1 Tax=Paenibacillus solanacearum TaxID=2048548 RepID=A0A916K2Z3_9BACL|nr:LTA synthase family protein [Paenibacillus solanacearum]CAG7635632.1 hypothetical protein PAESOLCIP111_03686 [Paenibacillus solanacearum]
MRPFTKGQSTSTPPKQVNAAYYTTIISAMIIIPLLLVFGIEFIQRGTVASTWEWIAGQPKLFGLNALLAFFVYLLVYCVFGSLVLATGISVLLMSLMSLISFFKVRLIGEPFFPWDIFLNKETMNILPLVTSHEALVRLGIVLALLIIIFASRLWIPRLGLRLRSRAVLGIIAVFVLYSFAVRLPWANELTDRAGFSEIVWNQQQNYGDNGLSLAFTMNVKNTIVPKPPGYSEPSMAVLAQEMNELAQVKTASGTTTPQKPNVIFIMNEAFWDPTLLPNVKFSEDPLPTVHRLQKESTSGYLLSPQFGGGTSNVEYEVLTGNSMSFLPAGSVPYQQYITKPILSLASYFKTMDYRSTAIHSYEGWFWNRENVYKQMNFDNFISKDQFDSPKLKGQFISDEEVSNRIIEQVENNEDPTFIYAVTMQNHGPYDDHRYGDGGNSIRAEGPLTDEARDTLETYTQGARDADQSLQKLIDHFKKSSEPTVIVFYGDHLPMLGYNYDVYAQAGFIHTGKSEQWSLEEQQRMHSVPFVMWSNMGLPKEQVPVLSDSFLGTYVLDRLQLELPGAWAYNAEQMKRTPGLLRGLVVDADHKLHAEVPAALADSVEKYRELQYDDLFGKQYFAKYSGSNVYTQAPAEEDGEMVNASGPEE